MSTHLFCLLCLLCAGQIVAATAAAARTIIQIPKADSNATAFEFIPLPHGVTGAESLAFDRSGQGPYAGVSDGRVFKWGGSSRGWTAFAYTTSYSHNSSCKASTARPGDTEDLCGRPLGLQFDIRTGDLYIADAYHGLLKVGPAGGEAKVVAARADGGAFNFVNGVDVDQSTGDVYFTDSSTTYTRRHNTQIMINREASGRLLKYDARAKRVLVLKDALPYPNGVAVSADRTHVVVAHTGPCQLFRYWLKGSKAGTYELFTNLAGYPDNIRRDSKGGYWVALNREKINGADAAAGRHVVGVRLDTEGVQHDKMIAQDKIVTLSDVSEKDAKLWLGSVDLRYIIVVNLDVIIRLTK